MPENFVEPKISFQKEENIEETNNAVLATYIATIYGVDWDFKCTIEKTKTNEDYRFELSDLDPIHLFGMAFDKYFLEFTPFQFIIQKVVEVKLFRKKLPMYTPLVGCLFLFQSVVLFLTTDISCYLPTSIEVKY